MSVDWEALAASVFVIACVLIAGWAFKRFLSTTPELWTGPTGRWLKGFRKRPDQQCRAMSEHRAARRASKVMDRFDVDEWAWELYVEDWHRRHPQADDLMSLADELFGPADDAGEGGNR